MSDSVYPKRAHELQLSDLVTVMLGTTVAAYDWSQIVLPDSRVMSSKTLEDRLRFSLRIAHRLVGIFLVTLHVVNFECSRIDDAPRTVGDYSLIYVPGHDLFLANVKRLKSVN